MQLLFLFLCKPLLTVADAEGSTAAQKLSHELPTKKLIKVSLRGDEKKISGFGRNTPTRAMGGRQPVP